MLLDKGYADKEIPSKILEKYEIKKLRCFFIFYEQFQKLSSLDFLQQQSPKVTHEKWWLFTWLFFLNVGNYEPNLEIW